MAQLIYTNDNGTTIELGQSAPFFVTNTEGFTSVENEITSTKSANQDGESIDHMSLAVRHLVIEGEYQFRDAREGRKRLTQAFNPKVGGELTYKEGRYERVIKCVPEKTPTIGRNVQATVPFIINLFAENPYWQDLKESREDVSTLEGGFEFPLNIPEEGLELAIRTISFITNVYNPGTVETPIRVSLEATGTVTNPIVTNLATGEYIMVKRTLSKGDKLEIDTQFGNKRVEIIRSNGDRENAFHYIDYKSTFFNVCAGDTEIEYGADVGDNNLDVYIYYTPRYLGV